MSLLYLLEWNPRRPSACGRGLHARTVLRFAPRELAVADHLGQDVALAQDQDIVGADLDLGPAVLGEDDLVALFHVHLYVVAVLCPGAGADREHAAALRLLLRR